MELTHHPHHMLECNKQLVKNKSSKQKLKDKKYREIKQELLEQIEQLKQDAVEEARRTVLLELQHEILDWQVNQSRNWETRLVRLPHPPRNIPAAVSLPRNQAVSIRALPPPDQWDSEWLERFSRMSVGDYCDLLMQAAHQTSLVLVPARTQGVGSAPYQEIELMTHKLTDLVQYMMLVSNAPIVALRKLYLNLETGEELEAPPLSWWEQLLRKLKISQDSIRRCVAAEILYRQRIRKLVEEQLALQACMREAVRGQDRLLEGALARAQAPVAQDALMQGGALGGMLALPGPRRASVDAGSPGALMGQGGMGPYGALAHYQGAASPGTSCASYGAPFGGMLGAQVEPEYSSPSAGLLSQRSSLSSQAAQAAQALAATPYQDQPLAAMHVLGKLTGNSSQLPRQPPSQALATALSSSHLSLGIGQTASQTAGATHLTDLMTPFCSWATTAVKPPKRAKPPLDLRQPQDCCTALQQNLQQQWRLTYEHHFYFHKKAITPLELTELYMAMYPYTAPFARQVYACLLPD